MTEEVNNIQNLTTIAKGGGISLIGALSAIVTSVIYQLLIARMLGPSKVGILNLGVSVASLVGVLVVFGLDKSVIRFVAKYSSLGDQAREMGAIRTSIRVLLISIVIVTPIFWGGADLLAKNVFNKPELTPILKVLALSTPFIAATSLLMAITQAVKRMEFRPLVQQISVPALKILFAVIAIYALGRSSLSIAYAILISAIGGTVLSIIAVRRVYRSRGSFNTSIPIGREMFHFTWPFLFTGLINRTNVQTETLVLGGLSTSDQVGIYTVGLKATVFITVFLDALNMIFAPIISELYTKGGKSELSRQFKVVTRWAFTLSLPIALVMFFLAPEIMGIFGPEFVVGASVLRMLAISQLIYVATGPVALMLSMTDYPRLNLINAILTVCVSLVFDYALIPRYGAYGAAIGGAFSIALINALRLIEVYFLMRVQPYSFSFLKPLISGVVAVIGTLGVNLMLFGESHILRILILGSGLVIIYAMALLGLSLDDDDRAVIRIFQRKLMNIGASIR